jgi:phosphoribosylglycinamide formyltransferase-1
MSKKKVAILISGRGSNMEALIKSCQDTSFPASIELVISNKKEAYGLEIAQSYGIHTQFFNRKNFSNDYEFDSKISTILKKNGIDIVCTAGYMKILTKEFVDSWRNQIINIHPSLLPAYKGLNTHKRVLNDGVQLAGCTTHIVERELDSGQILMQATVPVLKDDTEDALAKRILRMEHIIFPETLKRIATNQFRFDK